MSIYQVFCTTNENIPGQISVNQEIYIVLDNTLFSASNIGAGFGLICISCSINSSKA